VPADVATTLPSWSTTAGSNAPTGSTAISSNLDDNLRQIQAVVRTQWAAGTIASATTTNLSTVNERFVTVTGTTTITGLGTVSAGIEKVLIFSGALTLTHNGTSLILPGGQNIVTVANDTAEFLSLGSGNWICITYKYATNRAKRITSEASNATPTPNADTTDVHIITALAAGATFDAPTGTPTHGQQLIVRVKDNGTAQSLGWNSGAGGYRASTDLALPTTTVLGKTLYLGFMYNSTDSKWDLLAKLDNF